MKVITVVALLLIVVDARPLITDGWSDEDYHTARLAAEVVGKVITSIHTKAKVIDAAVDIAPSSSSSDETKLEHVDNTAKVMQEVMGSGIREVKRIVAQDQGKAHVEAEDMGKLAENAKRNLNVLLDETVYNSEAQEKNATETDAVAEVGIETFGYGTASAIIKKVSAALQSATGPEKEELSVLLYAALAERCLVSSALNGAKAIAGIGDGIMDCPLLDSTPDIPTRKAKVILDTAAHIYDVMVDQSVLIIDRAAKAYHKGGENEDENAKLEAFNTAAKTVNHIGDYVHEGCEALHNYAAQL